MSIVAALVVGGAWWFRAARPEPVADGRGHPSGSATSAPAGEERPDAGGPRSAGPLPPIPGAKVEAIAAGWAQRWGKPAKASAKGYDTTATLPGTAYRTRFGVTRSRDGDRSEVATLFCITSDPRLAKGRRLIRAVVDSCLAPALRGEEKAAVSTWLTAQDYSHDLFATRVLPRFVVDLVSSKGIFQVNLVSKGRTVGPGAVPTTDTEPAG
ncbi:hypothetical protein [Micromonospora okii]|uniref:hypothetical protein n=1 Tax=Micromonospora okii TaxID=1182970 RepID=UPI001E5EE4BF|nr:hypothetical protein [Micromonospora okii]